MTDIRCPLRDAARSDPAGPALIGRNLRMTFAELDDAATAVAANLRDAGIYDSDLVALSLPSDERCVILLLGLLRAGGTACPINTRLPPDAVDAALKRINASARIAEAALERVPGLVSLEAADVLRATGAGRDGPARRGRMERPALPMNADRPATILFTSGSTGEPKAALHTYANHYFSAAGSNRNLALGPGDRWLLSLPLYHVGGLGIVFRCLLAGACVVVPEAGEDVGAAHRRLGITHLSLVATQLRRLLRDVREGDNPLPGAKGVLLGGGAIPDRLLDEADRCGLPVRCSYGMTETASQVTTVPPDAPEEKRRTAGRVLAHRRLKIAEDGEILVGGDTLFAGYVLPSGGGVDPARDADGWFATGDLGRLDADGYLTVTGRKDNLFISGGENIHPEEIERALLAMDEVVEAVVVPVPDEEFGQRPAAFVRFQGTPVSAADLVSRLRRVLPRYKIPDRVLPWPESAEGDLKPRRAELAARAAASVAAGGGSARGHG